MWREIQNPKLLPGFCRPFLGQIQGCSIKGDFFTDPQFVGRIYNHMEVGSRFESDYVKVGHLMVGHVVDEIRVGGAN
jgi:hypothetical protein